MTDTTMRDTSTTVGRAAAPGDLFALQTLMGHAKADTSRGYTQVADQALTDAVNTI